MTPGAKEPAKSGLDLNELLENTVKSKPLDELLNEVMDHELKRQFQKKEEQKQRIILELVSASKIYEKMPLDRLAIKLNEDLNEILDLLEQIILNNEFTGLAISGKELIFSKVQRRDDLDRKPFLVVSSAALKPVIAAPFPHHEPLKRKRVDLKFKVLGEQPVEQVPVEPEILVTTAEVTPVSSQVQLKITITNTSTKPLDDVLVKYIVQGVARLVRMKPTYALNETNDEFVITSIPAGSCKRVLLFFSLGSCEPVEIDLLVQYKDAKGNFIGESLNEKIELTEPVFVKKQVISKDQFQEMITNQLKFKGIKSYGIPAGLPATDAYLIIKEILLTSEFEFVGEKFIEDKNQFLGWYYAACKSATGDKDNDFIVIGQVLNNKMEFFAMTNDATQLLAGLTHLAKSLRASLITHGFIEIESELVELACPSCGGVLDKFPTTGELHACKFCGAKLQF